MALQVRESVLRGEFGTDLTTRVAARLGAAFARFLHERQPHATVVVGRDTRASGGPLLQHFLGGLSAYPLRALDAGVVPTPALLVASSAWSCQAAVMVTAGRAPVDWNGFKFTLNGLPFDQASMKALYEMYRRAPSPRPARPLLTKRYGEAASLHLARVLSHFQLPELEKMDLRVAVDSGRGAAEAPVLGTLAALGAKVFNVHTVRENKSPELGLKPLATRVIRSSCHLGVATGWEGLLLILIDEKGRRLTRHQTLALAVRSYLEMQREKAVLVTPNSLSQLVRETARLHQAEVQYSGPLNRDMLNELASLDPERPALGLDLRGELTWPSVCFSPDSLATLVLVLRLMAHHKQPLSELVEELPPYNSGEGQVPCALDLGPTEIMERLATRYQGARISTSANLEKRRDAWWIRADLPAGGWVAVQHAFRLPVLDLWAEVPQPDRAETLLEEVQGLLGFVAV